MSKQASLNLLPALPVLDNSGRAALDDMRGSNTRVNDWFVSKFEHANANGHDNAQLSVMVKELIDGGEDAIAEIVKAFVEYHTIARWHDDVGRFRNSETEKKKRKALGRAMFDAEGAKAHPWTAFMPKTKKAKIAYDCDKALARHVDAEKRATISEAKALRKAFDEGLTLDGDVAALVERLIATANRLNITIDIPETFKPETV